MTSVYLDGGDVERRGDTKNGHDDGLVLLVDEDLHFSDVLFSGHLRDVLIGHVRLSGPGGREWTQLMSRNLITRVNPRLCCLLLSLGVIRNSHEVIYSSEILSPIKQVEVHCE